MDITTTAQYANIASGIVAIVTIIPTVMSFYQGWSVTVRRLLSGLFFISLGIAIGTSLVSRVPSPVGGGGETPTPTPVPASPVPAVSPSPSRTEIENKRLEKDLENLNAKNAASDERAVRLQKKLDALQEKLTEMENARNQTAPPEAPTPKPSPVTKVSDRPAPRQKLERFMVEVPRAQVLDGKATIYVRFTSTTSTRIKMVLPAGFQGDGKTFLVDGIGQQYDLDNASGIGTCCFGFAGGDWKGSILELPAGGNADVTLTFRRRGRFGEREPDHPPQTFTLTGELILGDVAKIQGWPYPQWQITGSASISIANIAPR